MVLIGLCSLVFCSYFAIVYLNEKKTELIPDAPDEIYLKIKEEIEKIHMYRFDRSIEFISTRDNWKLYPEDHIRKYGDSFVFYIQNPHSQQAYFIVRLLFNAKPVAIYPKKNIMQSTKKDGLIWYKESGCVIDIYYRNGDIKTYIMQNGLDIFYEKGKEDIYYEMPKLILNSFYISERDFLQSKVRSVWDTQR
jgi:hypothetical protein